MSDLQGAIPNGNQETAMTKALTLGLGLTTLALLAACTQGTISPGTVSPGSATPPAASAVDTPAPNTAAFGQRYTWPDGMAIEISKPVAYKPSPQAAGNTRERAVLVTVTMVNGTGKPYAFNSYMVGPQGTQGGEEAHRIFDTKPVSDVTETTLQPGASFTFRAAYSVGAAVGPFQLEATEAFGIPAAIFTGSV